MNKWIVVRDADKRKPIEVRTAEIVYPGANVGALIAKLDNSSEHNRYATNIALLPEIIAALRELVQTEEEYGDPDNAAVNASWVKAKEILGKVVNG